MNHRPCLLIPVLLASLLSTPLYALPGGSGAGGGGGHGGGGHGGGRFGGGGFSGRSFGHSIGHSFGHIFGHHSGDRGSHLSKVPGSRGDEPPLAGAAFIHGKVMQLPGPTGAMAQRAQLPPLAPSRFLPGPMPRERFRRNQFFDSGVCDYVGFSWRNFLFPTDSGCFGDPFFFAPFGSGGLIAGHFRSDSFITAGGFAALSAPFDPLATAHASGAASAGNSQAPRQNLGASTVSPVDPAEPDTLLQLRDGSMYGITRYWVDGGLLHYVTNYGGENTVPLDRIDLEKTEQLNATRGTPFVLPASSPNT